MSHELAPADVLTPQFRALLWLAAELPDAELTSIIVDDLPRLTTLGVHDDAGSLVGFVSFEAAPHRTLIEYIAVAQGQQGTGCGSRLITSVITHTGGTAPLVAETDDDAIGFYRKLGFTVAEAPRDARWPDRARYACTLPAGVPPVRPTP